MTRAAPAPAAAELGAPAPAEARAPAASRLPGTGAGSDVTIPPQAAYLLVDHDGRRVTSQHDDVLDTPMLAGSIMKPVTLLAALASGATADTTRIACGRTLRIDGRALDCVHPVLGHDLDAREAIAHSCNTFFASVARRLSRSALSRAALSLGLPPVPEHASLLMAAIGLDGARTSPRRWLSAFRALVAGEAGRAGPSVVLDGMRDAARVGSAMALAAHGIDAFAKTGTAPMPGGGTAGLVVVVAPGLKHSIVVVAPGGSGRDAAEIAGRVLQDHAGRPGVPGSVRVGIAHATGYDAKLIALDEYVAGVVDAEAPPSASPALRRLLAIVARTWMERHRERHAAEGFSVCDLTHCQVFRPSQASGRAAAAQARGILLRERDGALTDAAYSASCGGRLESGPDPADIAHADAWTSQLEHRSLLAALRPLGVGGPQIQRIAVVSRTGSGRARLLVVQTDRDYTIGAEHFRLAVGRAMGWQHLKSTWFDVEPYSRGFSFAGRGHGHGRGLCVLGAAAMIARGDEVEDVLAAYYPAAVLSADRDTVDVRVRVPASMLNQRTSLERLVHGQAAVLSVRLGIAVPPRIDVVVHPTVESFQRATGVGWWVGARSHDHQIDLAPVDRLARRGRLAVVMRHELVHLLTAARLHGRPRWVHEGLAVVMARETVGAGEQARRACPSDEEFLRATPGALPSLYAGAAACVTRALAMRPWTDIGAAAAPLR